jgi:uncharacterized membrane protein YphA (DoxX/SURF4 family)
MNLLQSATRYLLTTLAWLAASTSHAQQAATETPQPNASWSTVVQDHLTQVFFWGSIAITAIVLILLISITRVFEEWLDPLLFRIKRFAPYIMQATLGIGLILSAYYSGFLGPDLSLSAIFGTYAEVIRWMFYLGGVLLVIGLYPRLVSFAILLVAVPLAFQHTSHFLQHAIYIGEAGTIFFFGGAYHAFSATARNLVGITKEIRLHLHKYKFIILRAFFGISILTNAVYSQFLIPDNIPSSAANSALVGYFPDLTFFLLAVVAIEVLLGLFFIIGFEIRFASLAYLAFLVFSVVFFQQAIWPHVILVGTPLAMLTHGYDKYTVGNWLFSRGNLEPIL